MFQHLAATRLYALHDHLPVTLCCRTGAVWVTQTGDFADHLLAAGDCLRLPANPHTIVQALRDAELVLEPVAPVRV